MTKEQAIKQAELYRDAVQRMFPHCVISMDYIKGTSHYNFHNRGDNYNEVNYYYSYMTPLSSHIEIIITVWNDNTILATCQYSTGSKTMYINGNKVNGKIVDGLTLSEQLSNIYLTIIKRKL